MKDSNLDKNKEKNWNRVNKIECNTQHSLCQNISYNIYLLQNMEHILDKIHIK